MTDVYLIRHGETDWSRTSQHTSYTDLDLTQRGREQASRLRTLLSPADFDLTLTSPRLRARRTAEIAGFQPTIEENLAEWNYGDYEGLTPEQIRADAPDWQIWTHGAPGGESPEQVTERLTTIIDRIRSDQPERVAIFAHGHISRAFAACWLGWPLTVGANLPLETGAISVLGTYRGRPALKKWNA